MTKSQDLRGRTGLLANALEALAAADAIKQRRYIERHGCPADVECSQHGFISWERHIARIALEAAGIEVPA